MVTQVHLRQPADARTLEPEPARQPTADPLHRTTLVVVALPPVAGTRHRREHSPILGQQEPEGVTVGSYRVRTGLTFAKQAMREECLE